MMKRGGGVGFSEKCPFLAVPRAAEARRLARLRAAQERWAELMDRRA